jgi:hypothetical protein
MPISNPMRVTPREGTNRSVVIGSERNASPTRAPNRKCPPPPNAATRTPAFAPSTGDADASSRGPIAKMPAPPTTLQEKRFRVASSCAFGEALGVGPLSTKLDPAVAAPARAGPRRVATRSRRACANPLRGPAAPLRAPRRPRRSRIQRFDLAKLLQQRSSKRQHVPTQPRPAPTCGRGRAPRVWATA